MISYIKWAGKLRSAGSVAMLVASIASACAQPRLSTEFRLQYTDVAALGSGKPHADLPCQVIPEKPYLGFDLRFHADYRVTVPIKALEDSGGRLQVLMRVAPVANREEPAHLVNRFAVPDVPPGARGEGVLAGGFDLGLGRYQVEWTMRDGRGRACSSHWELEAKPRGDQRNLPLTLEPNMVAERVESPFADEPLVERAAAQSLHVKILLNLSPARPQESILKAEDVMVLLSMLRGITRRPGISRLTMVAFNMRDQKIIYRQDNAVTIDFGALGKALYGPTAGTVDYRLLQDPRSETHFLTKLLTDQLGARTGEPDAIVIVGPKVTLAKKVSLDSLKEAGAAQCPIFYLNYNPNPIDEPWPDTIGSALRAYKGALAYNIVFPRDLGVALGDLLSRIRKGATSEAEIGSP